MTDTFRPIPPTPEDVARAMCVADDNRRRVLVSEKILTASVDTGFWATLAETDPAFREWRGVTSHLRAASESLLAAFRAIHAPPEAGIR